MQTVKNSILVDRIKSRKYRFMISAIWILGLISGRCFAQSNLPLIINADTISRSILPYPNAALNIILTMLFVCAACAISHRLVYIFLFFKSFAYALIAMSIATAFGEAGWLLQILLLSTDTMLIIFLLLFLFRSAGKNFDAILRNTAITVIATAVLISFNLHIITPFTSSLLNG